MKAKVFFTLLGLLCISSGIVLGQLNTFDLSTYKNPFYKRSQLDLNFNLNGTNNWNKGNSSTFEPTNLNLAGTFQGNYFHIVNSPELQSTLQIQLSEDPRYVHQKNTLDLNTYYDDNSKSNNANLFINTSNRFYQTDLLFFEFDFTGNIQNQYNTDTYKTYNISNNSQLSNASSKSNATALIGLAGFRFGKGRLESVEDARLAVYILEDLAKHNRLSHTPSNEEILALSKLITEIKNKRFFDTRLRKIEEITAVDSFLNAGNLITSHDAAYFITVNDNWEYAAGPARTSGFRYSIGISPSETFNTGANPTFKGHVLGASADILFDQHKPLNLYWQFDGTLDLKYSLTQSVMENNPKENGSGYSANLAAKLGYYPNSRSYYSGSLGLNYQKSFTKEISTPFKSDDQTIVPQFTFNCYYYISQQLRLQGNYTVRYGDQNSNYYDFDIKNGTSGGKNFNQSFTIALTYSLF